MLIPMVYLTCTVRGSCSGPVVNKDSSADVLTYWNTFPAAVNDLEEKTLNPPFNMYCPPLINAARVNNTIIYHNDLVYVMN